MRLYYCNINNFGDALNKYIFEQCFDQKVEFSSSVSCDFIGIGSVLECALLQTKDLSKLAFLPFSKPLTVLSSGFGWEDEHYESKIRFFHKMIFKRKMNFFSLRGELTKKSVEKIIKKKLENVVLGDLGLLAGELVEKEAKKEFGLGICPHYADKENIVFQNLLKQNPNNVLLDTTENPVDFLKKLNKCEAIVSTGLHPLIAADSLGIPNLWARISEKTTTRHKFQDYYSIYGIDPQPFNLLENPIDLEFVVKNYKIDAKKVDLIKKNLIQKHREFFSKKNK